jgi:hypothetical protein
MQYGYASTGTGVYLTLCKTRCAVCSFQQRAACVCFFQAYSNVSVLFKSASYLLFSDVLSTQQNV